MDCAFVLLIEGEEGSRIWPENTFGNTKLTARVGLPRYDIFIFILSYSPPINVQVIFNGVGQALAATMKMNIFSTLLYFMNATAFGRWIVVCKNASAVRNFEYLFTDPSAES